MDTTQPKSNPLYPDVVLDVMGSFPEALMVCDAKDTVIWANTAAAQLLGTDLSKLLQSTVAALEKRHLVPDAEEPGLFCLNPAAAVAQDRPSQWLRRHEWPVRDGRAVLYRDVSEEWRLRNRCGELEDKLDRLSTIDQESGLQNRRAMLQNLEPLVSRSRRYNNPLSVIAMDLLNLGAIKQQYGEQAAKHTIKQLSYMLKDQLRWADIVSRTETERFVLVLPETNKESALHLANKINNHVAELTVDFEGNALQLQVCFGVAAWEKGNDSVLLLRNATQSLEVAKESGPGTVQDC